MIEILWKQDIDIGIPRDHFLSNGPESPEDLFIDQDTVSLKGKPTKEKVIVLLLCLTHLIKVTNTLAGILFFFQEAVAYYLIIIIIYVFIFFTV